LGRYYDRIYFNDSEYKKWTDLFSISERKNKFVPGLFYGRDSVQMIRESRQKEMLLWRGSLLPLGCGAAPARDLFGDHVTVGAFEGQFVPFALQLSKPFTEGQASR
jgi:hypothetical protein